MAGRTVNQEDIVKMNELYLTIGTYAGVAREVGFSATTVKRYIIPDFGKNKKADVKHFYVDDLPQFYPKRFIGRSWEELLKLTEVEKEEIEELWKELVI